MARLLHSPLASLLCALGLLLGCAGDPACERQIALMRAELIDLEDRYALLQAKYDDATGTYSEENSGGSRPLEKLFEKNAPKSTPDEPKSKDDIQIELDPQDLSSGVRFQLPEIARPAPRGAVPGRGGPPLGDWDSESPEPGDPTTIQPVSYESLAEPAADGNVLSSVLAGDLAAGELQVVAGPLSSPDPQAAAEGIELLLIPRASDGRTGWLPGDLSIAVLDPAEENPSHQRVGTWHFAWHELAGDPQSGDALPRDVPLRLPLTWNFHAPQHDQLRVLVRFVPHDGGEPLEAVVPVRLDQAAAATGSSELEQRLQSLYGDTTMPLSSAADEATGSSLPTWQPHR